MWVGGLVLAWTALSAFVGCVAINKYQPWYMTATLYEVYPRSFYDSLGTGVGNFKGLTKKVQHFKDIGVTAIWLSPMLKSPLKDFGYDIADYRTADPIFGTNDDLVEFINACHKIGVRILLDLVPNHTSDQHIWFQKSIKKEDPYTDYYIWSDGKNDSETGNRVPPNNWEGVFNGGAWEWNDERQQFYLHQFLTTQPDLNFRNQRVVYEMDAIITYWLDKGVDGFRVDALPYLYEDEELRDNPVVNGVVTQKYTFNQPENYDLSQHWAEVVYNYCQKDGVERALYLEAYGPLKETVKYYGTGKYSFMMPFNFKMITNLDQNSRPNDYKELIMDWIDNMPNGATPTWVTSNHDNSRAANRYSDPMLDAINMLTGVLPGCQITYFGEEIGMKDTFIRTDQIVDPAADPRIPKIYQKVICRDIARTPMQWDDSDNAGFSNASKTWLPVNPNYYELNVAAQMEAKLSHLKVYQAIQTARQDTILRRGDLDIIVPDNDTLCILRTYRDDWFILIINMASETLYYTTENFFSHYELDVDMKVVVSSLNVDLVAGSTIKKGAANIRIRPKGAVLLRST